MNPDTVQTIIQGGAVGLALVVIGGAYFTIRRSMELVNSFVTNHMAHLTDALNKNTEVLEHLDETVQALNRRLQTETERRKPK